MPCGTGKCSASPVSFPWSAVVHGTLAYTNGLTGDVNMFDRSGVKREGFRVSLEGPEMELRQAWSVLDATLEESDAPLNVLARMTDRSLGRVPRFARMFGDDEGRLWLKAYDPARDAMPLFKASGATGGWWRVVEMDGSGVARLQVPDDVAPLAAYGDQLLGLARDNLDVERFVVYRVIR